MKIKSLLCFFSLLPLIGLNGQHAFGNKLEPDPEQKEYRYGFFMKDSVKRVTGLRQFLMRPGAPTDTLEVFSYDRLGRLDFHLFYRENKLASRWWNIFEDTLMKVWGVAYPGGQGIQLLEFYTHDAKGDMIQRKRVDFNKGDTSDIWFENYVYDSLHHLLTSTQIKKGKVKQVGTYTYKDGKCISLNWKDSGSSGYRELQYAYNDSGILIADTDGHMYDTGRSIGYMNRYFYRDGKLILKRFGLSRKGVNEEVRYTYDREGRLATLTYRVDTFYYDVEYTYQRGAISSMKVRSNQAKADRMYRYFYNHLEKEIKSLPIQFERKYLYDDKGRLIEHQSFVSGECVEKTRWVIEYY